MNVSVVIRLCIMMFLEFFIWGAWYTTVGNYMDANGMARSIEWAYTVGPVAAIVSPFFLGMIADRFFASERVLAALSLLGGLAMIGVAFVAKADAGTGNYQAAFIILLLVHMLCYAPTLGLTNTLAFHNLTRHELMFPIVRVFGTFGWIVSGGWIISKGLHADTKIIQFYITAGAGIALAVFSLLLPHTPPPAKGKKASVRDLLGLDALSLMKSPSFAIFAISSFLICIPLATYYAFAQVYVKAVGFETPAFTMSFGQVAEVVFMLLMPLFFRFLGVKWMLLVGMAAWVVRYGLFAAAATASSGVLAMVILGILLHGICYDFFFVTGFIYTDKKAGKNIRAQAQGFLVLITQGLGMLIGAQIMGKVYKAVVLDRGGATNMQNWQQFWLIPCIMAGVIMLVFLVFFRDDSREVPAEAEAKPAETTQA